MKKTLALWITAVLLATPALSQDEAELAKKLANPVASLISVPAQANYDGNIGPAEEGSVWRINIQPVIPMALTDNWNLISRTILPVIDQQDIPVAGSGASGLGDIVQSFFFSPATPTSGGLIWGVGPVLLLPSASDAALGGGEVGHWPDLCRAQATGSLDFWRVGQPHFLSSG